jgi:hypothetical protein
MVAYLEGISIDMDSPSAARVAGMYLRGEASDWLVSHFRTLKASSLPEFGSWKEFLAELTTWCSPLDPTRRHYEDLLTLRQGKLEIRTYVLPHYQIQTDRAAACQLFDLSLHAGPSPRAAYRLGYRGPQRPGLSICFGNRLCRCPDVAQAFCCSCCVQTCCICWCCA